MTIHSFCQSVLSRFPLEAGISANFKPIEGAQQAALLQLAQRKVFEQANAEKTSPLAMSLRRIAAIQNEQDFSERLKNIMGERHQWARIKKDFFGVDGLYTALCQKFDIPAGKNRDDFIKHACDDAAFDKEKLRQCVISLANGSVAKDQPKAGIIGAWINAPQETRAQTFDGYQTCFLTNDGKIRSKLATKDGQKIYLGTAEVMGIEAERIFKLLETIRAAECAQTTADLFRVADAILNTYHDMKTYEGYLDFDDMILKTMALLSGETMRTQASKAQSWVIYKLDQGIDHILVDEAQDTNPEQWQIVKSLCEEFFDGLSAQETNRTLFVVGDEKQSIFSFQRAAPEKMAEMKSYFTQKISLANKKIENVPFNISFRSAPAILTAVDAALSRPCVQNSIGTQLLPHIPFRQGQAGHVEIWPIFKNDEIEKSEFLSIPTLETRAQTGAEKLAAHIAQTIKEWIGKEFLPSRNRAVQAGDIMILMRTRNAFVNQLIRALKKHNIPVSGTDRMVLSEQLCIEDVINAAGFALFPQDNLALACLLKSPFIGWHDDQIFNVCYGRGNQSLWDVLGQGNHHDVLTWLKNLCHAAHESTPHHFFASLLQTPCPASDISGWHAMMSRLGHDIRDPMEEFLNGCITYERQNTPHVQGFLKYHATQSQEIKREHEEAGNAVRIMTIHGAKGLQAPIVIMPDTLRTPQSNKPPRILWPSASEFPLPIFVPNQNLCPEQIKTIYEKIDAKAQGEYYRLMYVAMTRAEERLYVGGYINKKPVPDCWYDMIYQGLETCENIEILGDEDAKGLRLTSPQIHDADKINKHTSKNLLSITKPAWLFSKPRNEPAPVRPLSPSRPTADLENFTSPLMATDTNRFLRGQITHKLLEFLPALPESARAAATYKFAMSPAYAAHKNMADDIIREVMDILSHPKYRDLFGKFSKAEVPITGMLDDQTLISGQIDRLVVTDTDVIILDYKTNRPPPVDVAHVPKIYQQQMNAYARALAHIYPNKRIRKFLLWTDGARVMELR